MFLDDPGSKPARAEGTSESQLAAEAKERTDSGILRRERARRIKVKVRRVDYRQHVENIPTLDMLPIYVRTLICLDNLSDHPDSRSTLAVKCLSIGTSIRMSRWTLPRPFHAIVSGLAPPPDNTPRGKQDVACVYHKQGCLERGGEVTRGGPATCVRDNVMTVGDMGGMAPRDVVDSARTGL